MKRIFLFLAASLLVLMAANAQSTNKLTVPADGLQRIILGEDMKVVLVNATEAESHRDISPETLKKLNVRFDGATLEIKPHRPLHGEMVYVLVNDVRSISAGENTSVESENVLTSRWIELYLDGGATARLKTKGRVEAFAEPGVEVKVTRTPLVASSAAAGIN